MATMIIEPQPKLYDLQSAAKALGGISVWTLRKHQELGHLNLTRIGRRVFLSEKEVERIAREGLPALPGRRAGQSAA